MSAEIVLIGEGHGGKAALAGLRKRFDRIDLVTSDKELEQFANGACTNVQTLGGSSAPIAVLAGSRTIITEAELALRPIFNVHYSLLPKYRGLHGVVWAMLNDEPEIGLSVHRVNPQIDHGEILYQYALTLSETMTSRDVMTALNEHIAEHLGQVIREFMGGDRGTVPQDESLATWVAGRNRDDCLIDFDEHNRYLALFFRALADPYPLPQLICAKGRFEVLEHRILHRPYRAQNGRVVNVTPPDAYIKTAEGVLIVSKLRGENGKIVAASDVLPAGTRLAQWN